MRKTSYLTLMAMTLGLLAGCAQFYPPPPKAETGPEITPPAKNAARADSQSSAASSKKYNEALQSACRPSLPLQDSHAETTLKFAQSFSGMTAEEQKKEISRLGKDKSESGRLQLALALSAPASRFRDVPRALALLEEQPLDDSLRRLAIFLKSFLVDRLHYEETQQQSVQRLKEEQKRADTLQQKLDDLMTLEKTMTRGQQK